MTNKTEILFQKFIAGDCTEQEFHELMDLLQENQHEEQVRAMLQQVYRQVEQTLPSGTFVDQTGNLFPPNNTTPSLPVKAPVRRLYKTIAVAASVLIITSITGWLLWRTTAPATPITAANTVKKNTARSEQRYLLLPDGTEVWLNAASELVFPPAFEKNKREVFLTGEAFFDVKHADRIPFIIHTNNVVTKVLGTAFNIKAYPGQPDVLVTVKRGKVEVSKDNKVIATLTPGQQVQVPSVAAPVVKNVKEEEVAEWTSGKLRYDGRPLADILQDLERTYNVRIIVEGDRLAQEKLTTSFRRDIGVEQALRILCELTNAKLTIEKEQYIIR